MSTVSSVATDPLPWDGRRLAAQLAATGPTRPWRSAYEDDLVVELPTSTPADVAVAVTRARVAQAGVGGPAAGGASAGAARLPRRGARPA